MPQVAPSSEASVAAPALTPSPMPVFTHSGERYVLGYDSDVYGIWDRQFPQSPVQRFERSDEGWKEAWIAYSGLEPAAVPVGTAPGATQAPIPKIAVPNKTNSMAVAALITAILFIPIVPLVLGYISRREIDRSGGTQEGRGMALAGIILGWINLALVALVILAVVTFFSVFGDTFVDLIEQDADARSLLSNAIVEVQSYEQTSDSFEGLSPEALKDSDLEWNTLSFPIDGEVSIKDVGSDHVLLVTRTNLGVEYCTAIVGQRVSYGTLNPDFASGCQGGWIFDWQPPE